jgi:soluble lytic murein transglycosylase-like protein
VRADRSSIAACPAVAAIVLAMVCGSACAGSIFQIDDDSEAIHLTDRAAENASLVVAGEAPAVTGTRSFSAPFGQIVRNAASIHRLTPELLHAVITTESAYVVRAVSPRGALGLMQLMPATAREYGVTDAFDPQQNIDAGARHLRRLLDQFDNDTSLALAAYNAGAAAVLRHGRRIPPFAETTAYVPRVLRTLDRLRAATPRS